MKRRKGNVLGTLVLDVGSSAIDRERKKRHTRIRVVQWDMGRSGYDNDEVVAFLYSKEYGHGKQHTIMEMENNNGHENPTQH